MGLLNCGSGLGMSVWAFPFLLSFGAMAQMKPDYPRPTPEQVDWHEAEIGVVFKYL